MILDVHSMFIIYRVSRMIWSAVQSLHQKQYQEINKKSFTHIPTWVNFISKSDIIISVGVPLSEILHQQDFCSGKTVENFINGAGCFDHENVNPHDLFWD